MLLFGRGRIEYQRLRGPSAAAIPEGCARLRFVTANQREQAPIPWERLVRALHDPFLPEGGGLVAEHDAEIERHEVRKTFDEVPNRYQRAQPRVPGVPRLRRTTA
jgi:hypothetical protein